MMQKGGQVLKPTMSESSAMDLSPTKTRLCRTIFGSIGILI